MVKVCQKDENKNGPMARRYPEPTYKVSLLEVFFFTFLLGIITSTYILVPAATYWYAILDVLLCNLF